MQPRAVTETEREEPESGSVGTPMGGLATVSATVTGDNGDREHRHKKRILVIDDRPFRRESVVHLLREVSPECVFAALARPHDLDAGNPCPVSGETVDVVILDIGSIRLPDQRIAADIGHLGACFGDIPIILLSDREDSGQVSEALNYGVRGYIPTTLSAKVVAEALRLVGVGGTFIPASALVHALSDTREARPDGRDRRRTAAASDLTPREIDVLNLLREGKPNKIIAARLDLKETTVKIHVRHIMKKLKATNRTEAALMAERAL